MKYEGAVVVFLKIIIKDTPETGLQILGFQKQRSRSDGRAALDWQRGRREMIKLEIY